MNREIVQPTCYLLPLFVRSVLTLTRDDGRQFRYSSLVQHPHPVMDCLSLSSFVPIEG